ncbi:hypothetical protein DFR67_101477 [Williamsia limnetica]|jgi:hypothetical protein|uniref:FHA domain-containing protein n=1 Tax=Williamsia limnetica TaxID=882452 RepID=A0A318RWS4_WILLI|nr:hypothetical protein [Williamsia limnetica]PYE21083.1 hypothetical protein DFR67_101477 [Williamsia limnetica]
MTTTNSPDDTPVLAQRFDRGIAETFVDYCGERFPVSPDQPFHIGREADLDVDDNPYLHRKFLMLHHEEGLWWLSNVGSHLSAGVVAGDAGFQATLAPGARVPLVSGVTAVVFSAGPTTYELDIHSGTTPLVTIEPPAEPTQSGETTIGVVSLTESQKLLIVVLAEEVLRRNGTGASSIPSSAQAARRLGWSITKFNRKLDNVCDKFDQIGVSGMRGGSGRLASNRRVKLVEYAVASRLVTRSDLPLIDAEAELNGF